MFGKNRKFTEIFDKYYPLVISTICTKVEDTHEAEDICQEVFIKLYEKIDAIGNYRKWLYGAIRLEVLAHYRRKKGGDVSMEDVFDDVGLTFVNGFRDVRIIIEEAIENSGNYKDDTERDLLILISVHKYTYGQAGKLLGLTKRQVSYKYNLVIERIMDYLSKRGINSLEELL